MTNPTTAELLKYANLQMAAEAFIRNETTGQLESSGQDLINALVAGNRHASKFTLSEAQKFTFEWQVLDQKANTATGFSGTLFKYLGPTDASRGLTTGELVMSFRSTEFIDDAARDNMATNTLELKNTGWAWGQIADMQAWYQSLNSDPLMLQGKSFSLTGYSLGGHLATAFNLLNPTAAAQTVTFNGAGVGKVNQGDLGTALAEFNALRADPSAVIPYLADTAANQAKFVCAA